MADPLIKSVNQTPRAQDALKKRDAKKQRKQPQTKLQKKKDSKRIIDTYA